MYTPNAVGRNANNWLAINTNTALSRSGERQVFGLGGRYNGALTVDKNSIIHVLGMYHDNTYFHSSWYGMELGHWHTEPDNIYKWHFERLTGRSSHGRGMICTKDNINNNTIEAIYARGTELWYWSTDLKEGKFRDNGTDVTVIWNGTNTGVDQRDTVADYWNAKYSPMYFKTSTSVSANWQYSTSGMNYVYYGKYATTVGAPCDPQRVFKFYDNFERPYDGHKKSLFRDPYLWNLQITQGTWFTLSTSIISISSTRAVSGRKSVYFGSPSPLIFDPHNVNDFHTCYAYTALPVGFQNNVAGEISIWDEYPNGETPETNYTGCSLFGITYGPTHTVIAVRINAYNKCFSYYNGSSWGNYSNTFAPYGAAYKQWSRLKFQILNGKIGFYADGCSTPLSLTGLHTIPTSTANRVIFGLNNILTTEDPSLKWGSKKIQVFYDWFQFYKVVPQA